MNPLPPPPPYSRSGYAHTGSVRAVVPNDDFEIEDFDWEKIL